MSDDQQVSRADSYAGDEFWLKRGLELIAQSHPALTRQAQMLATAVAWFWTAHLAILGIQTIKDQPIGVLDVIPSGLLLLSYLAALAAQSPAVGQFDARSPENVRDAHQQSIRVRVQRLRFAEVMVAVSGVGVCVALVAR